MNNVILIGRLTKDVMMNSTQGGSVVANFTLAVNRPKSKNGEQSADFISCVAWNKTAEILEKYTQKGSQIAVSGSIHTRSYDNKEGKKVYVTEVVVWQVQLLGSKGQSSTSDSNIPLNDDDLPF